MGALREFVDCFVERVCLTWTGFNTSEINPRAREVTPWAPLMVALVVIAFPFALSLPAEYWRFSYWGGGEGVNRMEVLRNFALIVAGLVGFWLAWWRLRLTDQQTKTAERDSKQKELDHVAARFEKAITLLESKNEMSRIAGLNSLRDVAMQHPDRYLDSAIRQLCAFLRQRRKDKYELELMEMTSEFEEAFGVMGQLSKVSTAIKSMQRFDLRGVCFDYAQFSEVDFSQVLTDERSRFRLVTFHKCRVEFYRSQADAFFSSIFQGGSISGEYLNVSFEQCVAVGTRIGAEFLLCDFTGFQGSCLEVARPSKLADLFDGRSTCKIYRCKIDGASFADRPTRYVHALLEKEEIQSNFHADDFVECYVTKGNVPPDALHFNKPILAPRLGVERSEGGGVYVNFVEVGEAEVGDVTPVE